MPWRHRYYKENPLDVLMAEGSGWKHILNVLYPTLLGVSLKHEIESSLFDISLNLKRVQFLSRIMPRYPEL